MESSNKRLEDHNKTLSGYLPRHLSKLKLKALIDLWLIMILIGLVFFISFPSNNSAMLLVSLFFGLITITIIYAMPRKHSNPADISDLYNKPNRSYQSVIKVFSKGSTELLSKDETDKHMKGEAINMDNKNESLQNPFKKPISRILLYPTDGEVPWFISNELNQPMSRSDREKLERSIESVYNNKRVDPMSHLVSHLLMSAVLSENQHYKTEKGFLSFTKDYYKLKSEFKDLNKEFNLMKNRMTDILTHVSKENRVDAGLYILNGIETSIIQEARNKTLDEVIDILSEDSAITNSTLNRIKDLRGKHR